MHRTLTFPRLACALVLGAFFLASRSPGLATSEAAVGLSNEEHATPTPLWAGLLDHAAVALGAALPPRTATVLDGAYARHSDAPPQWWSCLRCADYRPTGGTWRILFDGGVMRVVYDVTGWRTLASYAVDGDRLRIFNDPMCPYDEGVYRWDSRDGGITLESIEDACAFGLRAENLTAGAWRSCSPPDLRAAVSDAWSKPPGCAPPFLPPPPDTTPTVAVEVFAGDARQEAGRLRWMAAANGDNLAPPSGVELKHADEVVPYGLNLILWEDGPWAEMTTVLPSEAMGVQFWGPSTMGVARVLFDGEEVWRGEVAQLGRHLQLFGGYVEVSGFSAGRHTLRVEHLGADGRPVTVLLFGGR